MIPVWKNIPFLRLLLPFIAGILCGWYFSVNWQLSLSVLLAGVGLFAFSLFKKKKYHFHYRWLPGAGIMLICAGLGLWITWMQQVPHQPHWFGHNYQPGTPVQLRLLEPPSERQKTFKARAEVLRLQKNKQLLTCNGEVILYFQKDQFPVDLSYGTILFTAKPFDEIKNAGNPGGFDYKRFALFKGITHQVFLKNNEYITGAKRQADFLPELLFNLRSYVLTTIKNHVPGTLQSSVAEALLVGYRDDLDRDLVQAFSNTGVVHIIAISGMHLGMIYVMLLFFLRPLDKWKRFRWVKALLILTLLWLFSLLTGGGASILRAVIMFSFITAAELFNRKANLYNSLAASAFLMLLFNPFLLWDVGFQLSYAAVLSIVLFMKPIYQWFSIQNKLLDYFWQLNAVTLSAQVLTLPLCMYHFHQSPNLFLLANMVAVPLSTLILYGLLFLMAVSFAGPASAVTGKFLSHLLTWMNDYIFWLNRFRFSVQDGIYHTPLQTLLLYVFIGLASIWLLHKKGKIVPFALFSLLLFFLLKNLNEAKALRQQRLIVYNLPQHQAIDFFAGKQHYFRGDSVLLQDGFLRNFHLKPARIFFGTYHAAVHVMPKEHTIIRWKNRSIYILSGRLTQDPPPEPWKADVLIVSKNPRISMTELRSFFDCKMVVFDSSNPLWKVERWKKESDSLHLPHFSTAHQGAFVMNWQ